MFKQVASLMAVAFILSGCVSVSMSSSSDIQLKSLDNLSIRAPLPIAPESAIGPSELNVVTGGFDIVFDADNSYLHRDLKEALLGSGVFTMDENSPYRLVVSISATEEPYIATFIANIFTLFMFPGFEDVNVTTRIDVMKGTSLQKRYEYQTQYQTAFSLVPFGWVLGGTRSGLERQHSAIIATNLIHDMSKDGLL